MLCVWRDDTHNRVRHRGGCAAIGHYHSLTSGLTLVYKMTYQFEIFYLHLKKEHSLTYNSPCIICHQSPGVWWGACGSGQVAGGTWSQHLHWEQRGEDTSPDCQGRSRQHTSTDRGGMMHLLTYKLYSSLNPHQLHNENFQPGQSSWSGLVWHIQMCNTWKVRQREREKLDWTASVQHLFSMGFEAMQTLDVWLKTQSCTKRCLKLQPILSEVWCVAKTTQ